MNYLANLKLLLGLTGTEKDALLSLLLEQATAAFLDYTNRDEVPTNASAAVLSLAVSSYNRLGTEGLESTSYSNINEKYSNTLTEVEKASLNRWRRLKLL